MNQEEFLNAFISALQNKRVIQQLHDSMSQKIHKKIKELKDLLQERESRIKDLEKKVGSLETRSENLEQYTRRNSLRIHVLKESEHEDVFEDIINLFKNDMALDTQPSDIDRIHRLGKKKPSGQPRPVLVKFATYRQRNLVFTAKSRLKNYNRGKIYVNEALTQERSELFFQARKLKREKKIQDSWTYDGRVILKTLQGNIQTVTSIDGLNDAAA